jgi:ABC-type polysaccharide/polyol phosphate export permease
MSSELSSMRGEGKKMPIYTSAGTSIGRAVNDLVGGLNLSPMWVYLTVQDLIIEFRRFYFGVLWIPLGMAVFVFVLGYVYSYVRDVEYAVFVPYLSAGMVGWQFMHTCILTGMNLFNRNGAVIRNVKLPLSYFIFKHIFRQFIEMLLVLIVFFVVMLVFGDSLTLTALWFVPAALLYAFTAFGVVLLLAVLSLRLRDIETPVSYAMRLAFLVTPILWMVDESENAERAVFVIFNPFYHFLEITRAPLLGEIPSALSVSVSLYFTLFVCLLAGVVFVRARPRIPYWV